MLSRLASLKTVQQQFPSSAVILRACTSVSNPTPSQVTFERRKRPIYPGKVRLGFIPDEWFQSFYPKTGVSGGYCFGFGLTAYLLSKEILVFEHELYTQLVMLVPITIMIKMFGPKVAEYLDKSVEEFDSKYESVRENSIKHLEAEIESEKFAQWQAEGLPTLYEAKRENIGLQLEAAYRERLAEIHSLVKKKLDYQLETSNILNKFEQRHMINWIVGNVRKGITPTLEAAVLKQCIADLKSIAAKA